MGIEGQTPVGTLSPSSEIPPSKPFDIEGARLSENHGKPVPYANYTNEEHNNVHGQIFFENVTAVEYQEIMIRRVTWRDFYPVLYLSC